MKPVFVLCEGDHDIAFLSRLLECHPDVKRYKKALKDYEPAVLSRFLIQRFSSRNVDGGRFASSGPFVHEMSPTLQAAFTVGTGRLLLLHKCGSDREHKATRAFLSGIIALAAPGAPGVGLPGFGVVFVRDADNLRAEVRLEELRDAFRDCLAPVLAIDGLAQNDAASIVRSGDFSCAACIFSGATPVTGTLEEVVIPLLRGQLENRFGAAMKFIEDFGAKELPDGGSKRLKAMLNIAGQIESPGCSLSVSLRDSPHLSNDGLQSCRLCQSYLQVIVAM